MGPIYYIDNAEYISDKNEKTVEPFFVWRKPEYRGIWFGPYFAERAADWCIVNIIWNLVVFVCGSIPWSFNDTKNKTIKYYNYLKDLGIKLWNLLKV